MVTYPYAYIHDVSPLQAWAGHIVAAARLQLVQSAVQQPEHTGRQAYGYDVGRRMVVARSNCN